MDGGPDIAAVGALLAEPARARMLLALDQRALPASVLALEAGSAPSTASGHLARARIHI
jgi:DNA-binding transcriptional ArsR family regulator